MEELFHKKAKENERTRSFDNQAKKEKDGCQNSDNHVSINSPVSAVPETVDYEEETLVATLPQGFKEPRVREKLSETLGIPQKKLETIMEVRKLLGNFLIVCFLISSYDHRRKAKNKRLDTRKPLEANRKPRV